MTNPATDYFCFAPWVGSALRANLTPHTQTCPACLPVLLYLLSVVLLFRLIGPKRNPPPLFLFFYFGARYSFV